VEYNALNFVEKNKDELQKDIIKILAETSENK
jgi:myosin heavy subunit